jgi:hypothetical protein
MITLSGLGTLVVVRMHLALFYNAYGRAGATHCTRSFETKESGTHGALLPGSGSTAPRRIHCSIRTVKEEHSSTAPLMWSTVSTVRVGCRSYDAMKSSCTRVRHHPFSLDFPESQIFLGYVSVTIPQILCEPGPFIYEILIGRVFMCFIIESKNLLYL